MFQKELLDSQGRYKTYYTYLVIFAIIFMWMGKRYWLMQYVSMDAATYWLKVSLRKNCKAKFCLSSPCSFYFSRAENSLSDSMFRSVPLSFPLYTLLRSVLSKKLPYSTAFNIHCLISCTSRAGISLWLLIKWLKEINKCKVKRTTCLHFHGYFSF